MIPLLAYIKKNLIWAIPVTMIAGFMVGLATDARPLKQLIVLLTFLMVYPMMVNLQVRNVFDGGDLKVQFVAQFLNFAVIPLCAYVFGKVFFPDSPYIALGLLLASLLPTSGMTISWTGMAHGNMAAAVKMTVFGLLIGSFLTPIYIKFLMGTVVTIPLARIFKQIVIVVFLPLVLGNLTQRGIVKQYGMARYQKDFKPIFPLFSTLGVLGVVFVALALKAKAIAANPGQLLGIIVPLLILYAANFAVSTIVGRLLFSRGDSIALVYGTVMRNLSIALAIAMTAFQDHGSDIALIIALAYIVQVQSAAWYVKFTNRIFGPAPEAKVEEVMLKGVFALSLSDTLRQAAKLLAEEHIHSLAVLDADENPVGMISSDSIIDALADEVSYDTPLSAMQLAPVMIASGAASLKEVLADMKRAHEYKGLILDGQGKVSHVVSRDEILLRLAADN